ncbi:hypothetical protein HG530_010401 [Fusarium avenaceum]|nr:hypothetical protein HG530_010401 [Fusarium avenaceum]
MSDLLKIEDIHVHSKPISHIKACTNGNGRELNNHVLELLGLVGASLEKLRDDGNSSDVEECAGCEGKKHITPGLASSPDTLVATHGSVAAAGATKLLHGNTNQSTEKSSQSSDELRTHGSSLGKARLDEKSKIADLVGDFVEEDGDCGGSSNSRRSVEAGRHGQAVSNVVGEVGTVYVATHLNARVDLLLGLLNSIGNNSALVLNALLARLDITIYTQSKNKVTVRLDKNKLDSLIMILTNKDLGKQMEQSITKKTSNGKSNHHGQRGRVDVGRAQSEEEVGRAGNVEGRKEGVHGGRTREENGEKARGHRRGCSGVVSMLCGVKLLDNGAGLEELMSARDVPRERSFVTYLELRVQLFKTHTVEFGSGNGIHMLMFMAGIRKTNQEGEADSRAKDALTSERHGVYICPLEFWADMIESVGSGHESGGSTASTGNDRSSIVLVVLGRERRAHEAVLNVARLAVATADQCALLALLVTAEIVQRLLGQLGADDAEAGVGGCRAGVLEDTSHKVVELAAVLLSSVLQGGNLVGEAITRSPESEKETGLCIDSSRNSRYGLIRCTALDHCVETSAGEGTVCTLEASCSVELVLEVRLGLSAAIGKGRTIVETLERSAGRACGSSHKLDRSLIEEDELLRTHAGTRKHARIRTNSKPRSRKFFSLNKLYI